MQIDDTGIDHGAAIRVVDRADRVHAREGDDDAAANCRCTPGKARARAPWHDWHSRRCRQLHDLSHLPRVRRQYDNIWHRVLMRAVRIVHKQVSALGEHVILAKQRNKAANKRCAINRRHEGGNRVCSGGSKGSRHIGHSSQGGNHDVSFIVPHFAHVGKRSHPNLPDTPSLYER